MKTQRCRRKNSRPHLRSPRNVAPPAERRKRSPPVEKAAPSADVRPAAARASRCQPHRRLKPQHRWQPAALARPAQLPASAIDSKCSPAAALTRRANPAKNTPPKKREVTSETAACGCASPRPTEQTAVGGEAVRKSNLVGKSPGLTALTGVLAFVLGEQFSTHVRGRSRPTAAAFQAWRKAARGPPMMAPVIRN